MTERDLHNQFIAYLQKHGYVWRRDRMDKRTSAATGSEPDFWVAKNGRCCWIEFKVGKNKPSAAQQKRFAELHAAGCIVAVCYSLEEAVEHVEDAFEPHRLTPEQLFRAGHLDCVGEEQCKTSLEQFYLVKSRTPGIGTVVVRYDTDGAAIYVRQANAHDIMTMPSAG